MSYLLPFSPLGVLGIWWVFFVAPITLELFIFERIKQQNTQKQIVLF
jgi:hypothetical protein